MKPRAYFFAGVAGTAAAVASPTLVAAADSAMVAQRDPRHDVYDPA